MKYKKKREKPHYKANLNVNEISGSEAGIFKRYRTSILVALLCFILVIVLLSYMGMKPKTGNENNPANTETRYDFQIPVETPRAEIPDFVDLTALSSTMVYAEVYNITTCPTDYMGKTIKMSGPYYAFYYDETDSYYYYVMINDAAACCQQGIEFIWNGEHTYPDDYPADKTNIETTGIFSSYEEQGETYYYLAVDDILIKN